MSGEPRPDRPDHAGPLGAADPTGDDAERVVAILVAEGVDEDEARRATTEGRAAVVLLQQRLLPEPVRYTREDMERIEGDDFPLANQFWRAMGFPDTEPGKVAFSDYDLRVLGAALERFGDAGLDIEGLVQQARIMAASVQRVAEGLIDVVFPPAGSVDADGVELTQEAQCFFVLLLDIETVTGVLDYMLRRQLVAAADRRISHPTGFDGQPTVVGFADLADFTDLSRRVSGDELGTMVMRFDATARDLVAHHGGRVVKTIGDEVLFVADDPMVAARIALDLVAAHDDDPLLPDVRVGLDRGPVLGIGGDVFGPTVNRASRITSVARPQSVLVSRTVREELRNDPAVHTRHVAPTFLKGIGETELFVLRDGPHPRRGRAG